jgi:hypothetical protein
MDAENVHIRCIPFGTSVASEPCFSESVQPTCVVGLFDQGGDSMRMHEVNRMDEKPPMYKDISQ